MQILQIAKGSVSQKYKILQYMRNEETSKLNLLGKLFTSQKKVIVFAMETFEIKKIGSFEHYSNLNMFFIKP